jgi:RNA polymerase sigma-70 factor (ECF subfamily)
MRPTQPSFDSDWPARFGRGPQPIGAPPVVRDRQLMEEVIAGCAASFNQLYDRYCHRAYRVAFSVCRDHGRAQDAVQEAFLSIWSNPAGYRSHRGAVAPWLLTIVRYRAIDVARRSGHHPTREGVDRPDGRAAPGDIAQTAIDRDDADRLHASLSLLPEAQLEVIVLAFYGELSHNEIATHLGLPAGTIKGRVRLGLEKLRADIPQPVT